VSRQDVIKVFSKPKVDYGGCRRHIYWGAALTAERWTCEFTGHACYIGVPLYICGFLVLGDALRKRESVGELVMGWGIAMVALMVNTVAVCAFLYVRQHSRRFLTFRFLRQRLLSETPGGD